MSYLRSLERHRMNQDQFAIHSRELDDLTKRNQQLFDQWTRVDIECGRVSEDLHVANSLVDRLRNECANLRAEKKIWEVRIFVSWPCPVLMPSTVGPRSFGRRKQDFGHGALASL